VPRLAAAALALPLRGVAGFARDPACFAEERRHCSESAAAEWALCGELALPAVREALHRRHGDRAAALPEEAVRRLLELALARVAAAPGQVV
jgi:hypothetical protein